MAIRFHELPVELFTPEQQPYIRRLNMELRQIFALEGVLGSPTTDTTRSDNTIVRQNEPAVAVTRVTPSVSGSGGSSVSVTIGTPALSFDTVDAPGSTTSVISINSQIALFGTQAPIGVSSAAFAGSSGKAARADHVHTIHDDISTQRVSVARNGAAGVGARREINFVEGSSTSISVADDAGNNQIDVTIGFSGAPTQGATPSLVFSTSAAEGTSTTFLRTNAQIPIFQITAPTTLRTNSVPASGSAAFAARRDHVHALDVIDDTVPVGLLSGTSDPGTSIYLAHADHIHKSQTDGDFYASGTTRGLITKDVQATARYWRIRVQGDTSVVTGGCTLSITSGGTVTALRDSGSSGTIVIRVDDFGTVAP